MGVILPGVERDGIFPQFFRGIGTGRNNFLWEWDGRGLRIHSRVTLCFEPVCMPNVTVKLPHQTWRANMDAAHTTLTFSSSLRMTRLWWVSLATEMRQTTGVRWATWLGGAGSTISLWMWRRQRRLLLISGKCTLTMLLWPSTVRLWRERAAPSFWVCTSQRTSPGLTTLQHWPRKHSNVSTSSANSEEPEPWTPSCALSTEAPSRASWLAASLCGMAPATRTAASPFNG